MPAPSPSLPGRHPAAFALYAGGAAFLTYFCMYAFRKPFSAATYAGQQLFGLDYKVLLATVQVAGYMTSKIIGVRFISQLPPHRRAATLLGLVAAAEAALVLFGLVPYPYQFVFLFFNGLPLGLVWGLVFGFLEGRRLTEVLGAFFAASVIMASGVVKTAGRLLLGGGVPESWMPALTGLLFTPPLLLGVYMLTRLPPPTPADVAERMARPPLPAAARRRFFRAFRPGLVALVLTYAVLGAFRDYRDNFAVELWQAAGMGSATAFAGTESLITLLVLALVGSLALVKDHRRALLLNYGLLAAGCGLLLATTAGYAAGRLGGQHLLLGSGLGLFMGYLPFQCLTFERLIALLQRRCNVGFLFYLADASAYVGSVGVMVGKSLLWPGDWLSFYLPFARLTAGLGLALGGFACLYFARRTRPRPGLWRQRFRFHLRPWPLHT